MKISQYNPVNMNLISDDVTGVDFGVAKLGDFCTNVIAIKPVAETEILTAISLFLEDRANLDHTRFGLYKSATPINGIVPGDSRLDTYLVESPGVSDLVMFSGNQTALNASDPEYVWLDAKAGSTEDTFGASTVNYRFVFEYN